MFFRAASFYFFSGWVESIVAAVHIETAQKYFHLFSDFTKYAIIIDRGSSFGFNRCLLVLIFEVPVVYGRSRGRGPFRSLVLQLALLDAPQTDSAILVPW